MKCVLYARVSTDKQAEKELSIPAQLQAMRDYAKQRSWEICAEFVEPGASARTAQRPQLQKMLTFVRDPALGVGTVLVHKIDRLARSVYDHATIKALLQQHDVRLASVVENFDETVSGALVENIMASIAQFYSANLSEEVKKGMRQKVLNGGWPHVAPVGYVQIKGSSQQESRIAIHQRLGHLVTRCFELYLSGLYSPKRLVHTMANEGLTTKTGEPLSPAHLRHILQNPFYAGRICWNGLDVNGTHEPLVPRDVFDNVQRLLKERSRHRGRKGRLEGVPLRGVAICATCRGHMTAERHERYLYYRCSRQAYRRALCSARFCNADRAHADLRRICLQIQITRESARAVGKAVRRRFETQMSSASEKPGEIENKSQQLLLAQMEAAEEFAQGRLSSKDYATTVADLRRYERELSSQQKQLATDPQESIERVEKVLGLATSLWDLYEAMTDRKRAELLSTVFSTVALSAAGVVGFALTEPLKALQRRGDASDEVADRLMKALLVA